MIRHEEKQREGILPKPSNSAAFSTFSSGDERKNVTFLGVHLSTNSCIM